MTGEQSVAVASAATHEDDVVAPPSPPAAPKVDKGKGKAKAVEPEQDEDEEEEVDEEESDEDDDDEDLDQDLEDLINDVDPSDIVPVTRQRSARSKNIDYSSAEAMQRAGLDGSQAHTQQEEDDTDFKGDDETMEDDY